MIRRMRGDEGGRAAASASAAAAAQPQGRAAQSREIGERESEGDRRKRREERGERGERERGKICSNRPGHGGPGQLVEVCPVHDALTRAVAQNGAHGAQFAAEHGHHDAAH